MQKSTQEFEQVLVRNLRPEDLEAVVALDAKNAGRRREQYFKVKLQQALAESGVKVSLAAERDGHLAGFCLARVFYGEFGQTEAVAVLDTFDVAPDEQGHGVGGSLIRQLRTNLLGLGIKHLQTQVEWSNQRLLSFFQHAGFEPAPRIALDLDLAHARRREETEAS